MADSTGSQVLKYWNADIDPLSLEFERDAADICDPGVGYLAMGVTGYASHFTSVFHGKLGFKSDGNLITLADGLVSGRDSRLAGPNTVRFPGPKNEIYSMDLTSKLYYNNFDSYNGSGEQGFVNLAGQINVPFFKDMKIHLQTRGDKDSTIASMDIMGGWPDHGWEISGQNFFTQAPFDESNRGYPTSHSRDYYRNMSRSETSQDFLPRAQQSWLGVVNFDYPMNWSQFDRSFSSYKAEEDKFLIVEVEHEVPYLSANSAEMVFGAQYDGIPQLSLANFAQSLIDDNVMGPMRDAVDQGKESMANMLNDQVMRLFDPVLDGLVDPLVDELYEELREVYEDAATSLGLSTTDPLPFADWEASYNNAMHCYVTGPQPLPASCPLDENLLGLLGEVIGAVDDVSGLLKEIDKHLANTELVIDVFTSSFKDPEGRVLSDMDGMFVCDNSGNINFAIAEELVKRLLEAQDLGIDLSVLARAIDEKLQPLFQDHMPTLKRVAETLLKLKTFIGQVRTVLQDGGEMIDNLRDKLESMNTEITGVVTDVDTRVKGFFQRLDNLNSLVSSPFEEYTAEDIKAMIKQEIKDAFYSSPIGTELQVIIKQNLFDANGAICRGIDDVFAQINKVIEDLLSEVFADLDEKIIPFLDKLNGIIGAGKLDGYAHLSEDAIRYARMDANLEWEIPEPMSFHGYIEIKQLNAEGSDNACYAESPGVINEVTIGATDIPLNWVSEGLRADVYGKTTFQTAPDFKLLGIGGGFEITEGEIKFEKFVITDLGAALALGKEETFLAAKAHAKFESVQAGVGAFFGRTCTVDPLVMVDPDVGSMLGGAPFTGAYIYGEAWIPILDYSCALRLSAGAGIGLGYFVEGPTYVGKMKLGVSGEALCVVSVTGEIVLVGIKQGDDFKFKGTGTVKGEVGKCRWFCIKFNKSVTIEK